MQKLRTQYIPQFPDSLRQPHPSPSTSDSPYLIHHLFFYQLTTLTIHHVRHSFSPSFTPIFFSQQCLHKLRPATHLLCSMVLVFRSFLLFFSVMVLHSKRRRIPSAFRIRYMFRILLQWRLFGSHRCTKWLHDFIEAFYLLGVSTFSGHLCHTGYHDNNNSSTYNNPFNGPLSRTIAWASTRKKVK